MRFFRMLWGHAKTLRRRLAMPLLLTACAFGLGAMQGLGSMDLALTDLLRWRVERPAVPIVIVEIDDISVEALGRWPWSRLRYAELIEQLMLFKPKAIGLDLILSEPGDVGADSVLADVLARARNVVLPVVMHPSQAGSQYLVPARPFLDAAAALGRIDIVVDPDSVVRSVWLNVPSQPDHFAVSMLKVGQGGAAAQAVRLPAERVLLDFRARGDDFPYVSFADVLAAKVSPSVFRDAYVLIGVTGTGMGDAYPTPALQEKALRPGVHILAAAMENVASRNYSHPASWWGNALASALPVMLLALWLRLAPPSRAWLALAPMGAAYLVAVMLLRTGGGLQVMPLAGLLGLLVVYVQWSTARFRGFAKLLRAEATRIRATGPPSAASDVSGSQDSRLELPTTLEGQLVLLRQETDTVLAAKKLLEDSLSAIPDATFVTDGARQILLAWSPSGQGDGAAGSGLAQPMDDVIQARFPAFFANEVTALFDSFPPESFARACRDVSGTDFLVKAIPRCTPDDLVMGWIVSVIDLGAARQMDGDSADSLQYLSHDLRAPQASILSLLDLRRMGALGVPETELLDRIGRLAERTLSYADNFIQLARADSAQYVMRPHDLLEIATEVAQDLWSRAQSQQVVIQVSGPPAVCMVDRALVARAIQNLLDNALKFSPAGERIECTVSVVAQKTAVVSVRDFGAGIPSVQRESLFAPFAQSSGASGGVGLGLAFVRTIARRHGGAADARDPASGPGALFTLEIPLLPQG